MRFQLIIPYPFRRMRTGRSHHWLHQTEVTVLQVWYRCLPIFLVMTTVGGQQPQCATTVIRLSTENGESRMDKHTDHPERMHRAAMGRKTQRPV